jgi:hypothetical protein
MTSQFQPHTGLKTTTKQPKVKVHNIIMHKKLNFDAVGEIDNKCDCWW